MINRYESCELTDSPARDLLRHVLVVASGGTIPDTDLYFIQVEGAGPIKIGVSSTPHARLAALQTACPYRLELRHVEPRMGVAEKYLHRRLSDQCLQGEWFNPCPELDSLMNADVVPEFVLDAPFFDGVTPWRDVDRARLDQAVESAWQSFSASRMWGDRSRILRKNYLRNAPSIGALYDEWSAMEAA